MADERTLNNAMLGRLYYQMMTDSAGYPNGMPYWADLSPNDKYRLACEGMSLLEAAQHAGFVTITKPIGLGGSSWGEGECKALLEHFAETQEEEKAKFETFLKNIGSSLAPKAG